MTEKRFYYFGNGEDINSGVIDKDTELTLEETVGIMNELAEKNKEFKKELLIYRKIASCSNCEYQNYDWFDDGDEFEICERGNNEQQIDFHICEEWREI